MQSGNAIGYSADPRNKMNTSDHTYQAATFELENDKAEIVCKLKGATWNLMNFCRSKTTNGGKYANNAWDIDETDETYFDRKARQLNKILELIDKEQYDFMFLQEIDILMPAHPARSQNHDYINRLNQMRDNFIAELRKRNMDIIISKPSKKNNIKPLATIYNAKKLAHKSTSNVLLASDNQYKGFKNTFKMGEQTISLTNLHLHYPDDYSSNLPELQSSQVNHDEFNIMGGDTNHAPNNNIEGLINNWNNITNIDGIEKSGKHKLTGKHKDKDGRSIKQGNNSVKKCYDCFLSNPTSTTRVKIRAESAEVFQKNADGEFEVVPLPASKHIHISARGKPWVRGGYQAEQLALIPGKDNKGKEEAKEPSTIQAANQPATQKLIKRPDFNPQEHESNQAQAQRVFDLLMTEVKSGRKCAILYAANNKQADLLFAYNKKMKGAMPDVNGSGQAALFHELIKLINEHKERIGDAICVIPIATSLNGGADAKGNQVHKDDIDRCISEVALFLQNGYFVYGMPRKNNPEEYSIGGGQSKNWMTAPDPTLKSLTKNDYFQERMKQLENLSCQKNPDYGNLIIHTNANQAAAVPVPPVAHINKPKSEKLYELLLKAQEVYIEIEGKKGLKGKKLRSAKHEKDFNTLISLCQDLRDTVSIDDNKTFSEMIQRIYNYYLNPAKEKYSTSSKFFCRNDTLEARLQDSKHRKHHHMTRLMLAVLDAATRANLLNHNDEITNAFIPEEYKKQYQKVYSVVGIEIPEQGIKPRK